jgi:4-amino-4-deoxychorismate synthase (2-amino-4-deoxychorismate-forming) component I
MDIAADKNFVTQLLPSSVDLFDLHSLNPEKYPFLLQSAAQGRYDFLFAVAGEALVLHADGSLTGPYAHQTGGNFLRALDCWWRGLRLHSPCMGAPPFRGGWFLFLAYELASQIEPSVEFSSAPGLPMAMAIRVPAAYLYDHESHAVQQIAELEYTGLMSDIHSDAACAPVNVRTNLLTQPFKEEDPQRYIDDVDRARRYIHDGDIFQANLSRRWLAQLAPEVKPAVVYCRLCKANPAPFAGIARLGTHTVISSSPERLVRVHGRRVEVRPIAGTRPRSNDVLRDRGLVDELISHPKERAEHVMLLDLARNDLGRICNVGSVHVDELMAVESYRHVHHIVSNVCGQLRPEATPGEVIRAVFPGGTITGCPKVRCMQIISELERTPRGAYTGAMGYLNRDGDLDLNILIRTFVQHGRQLEFRAGAGIVADSIPERELQETRDKALGLVRALSDGT